jgi:cytidine deaminase
MKKIEINTSFTAFQSIEELPQDVEALMQKAIEIRKKAYAPYSKFKVGAALQLDNGKIIFKRNGN